jgi:hypothetical protein
MGIADLVAKITTGHSKLITDDPAQVSGQIAELICPRERNADYKMFSYEEVLRTDPIAAQWIQLVRKYEALCAHTNSLRVPVLMPTVGPKILRQVYLKGYLLQVFLVSKYPERWNRSGVKTPDGTCSRIDALVS